MTRNNSCWVSVLSVLLATVLITVQSKVRPDRSAINNDNNPISGTLSLIDKAKQIANSLKPESPAGSDACDGCPDDCNKWAICGTLGIHNQGAFVAKACVSGNLNSTHYCCTTDSFDEGQWQYLNVPCYSSNILLIGEELVFKGSWSVAGEVLYQSPDMHDCWSISGTTLNNHWSNVSCEH